MRKSKYSETIINFNQLSDLANDRYEKIEDFFNQEMRVLSGFVDTQFGVEQTSKRIMEIMRELEVIGQIKMRNQEILNIARNNKFNIEKQEKNQFARQIAIPKMYDRRKRFGMELVLDS